MRNPNMVENGGRHIAVSRASGVAAHAGEMLTRFKRVFGQSPSKFREYLADGSAQAKLPDREF